MISHSDPAREAEVRRYQNIKALPEGAVLKTIHGNRLRKFENGFWSPLSGAHWDRWTEYNDAEITRYFPGARVAES